MTASNEDRRQAAARVRTALTELASAIDAARALDVLTIINTVDLARSQIMAPMTDE